MRHGRNYFSPSQLKKLTISIGQLQMYIKRKFITTSSMNLGTAVHCAILEPFDYDDRFAVLDDDLICLEVGGKRPTSTSKYKEWLAEFESENKGKILLTKKEQDIVNTIVEKCEALGIIDAYFSGGEAEIETKGLVDEFLEDFDALCIIDYDTEFMSVDLKTTSKPLHKFKYDANELGYDIQAKLTNSINNKEFVFVVVQTVAPYDIGIFQCSDYFMDRGATKINQALANYSEYKDANTSQILEFTL